jgi:hypothetical protein
MRQSILITRSEVPFGTKNGWQHKRFGEDAEFAGADVFVGPAWSTPKTHQKEFWKLFGDLVARQPQSRTEKTQASPPAILTASRKRQALGYSTSPYPKRRLKYEEECDDQAQMEHTFCSAFLGFSYATVISPCGRTWRTKVAKSRSCGWRDMRQQIFEHAAANYSMPRAAMSSMPIRTDIIRDHKHLTWEIVPIGRLT